jgi:DNA-binding Xre family transcriptional regulator
MAVRLKVKEIAQQKNMSMGLLGRLANVEVRTMRKIYRTPTASVTTHVLGRLADALGVDISEIVESVPDEPPRQPD